MKFSTKTTAPEGQVVIPATDRTDQVKDLLFSAVKILIDDHAEWKDELLALLSESTNGTPS